MTKTIDPGASQVPESLVLLRRSADLFQRWCAAAAVPSRAEFDPLGLDAELLNHTFLVEVVGSDAIRFRLVSAHLERLSNRRMHGQRLQDFVDDADYVIARRDILACLEEDRPVFRERQVHTSDDRYLRFARVLFPLKDDPADGFRTLWGVVEILPLTPIADE